MCLMFGQLQESLCDLDHVQQQTPLLPNVLSNGVKMNKPMGLQHRPVSILPKLYLFFLDTNKVIQVPF